MICPTAPHTHSIDEVCGLIGCDSEDWLIDRVRNGTFPGRRVVRTLRFSDGDINQIIEACVVTVRQETVPQFEPLRATSRRKAS